MLMKDDYLFWYIVFYFENIAIKQRISPNVKKPFVSNECETTWNLIVFNELKDGWYLPTSKMEYDFLAYYKWILETFMVHVELFNIETKTIHILHIVTMSYNYKMKYIV